MSTNPILTVGAIQMACTWDHDENLRTAERLIRAAAVQGAQFIALPELFETPYFCQQVDGAYFDLATPIAENPAIEMCQDLASELDVVLPVSTFERDRTSHFNSVSVVDAGGELLGTYRKTHIPDGPGYYEKFYFWPGDTGLMAFRTKYATVGVGICWDQWFPESGRGMALAGAEVLCFPTAIGSSPMADPATDMTDPARHDFEHTPRRREHWRNVQIGQAAANMMPLVAANRIGLETIGETSIEFFGSTFIANHRGSVVAELGTEEGVIVSSFDRLETHRQRTGWGLFRDRRPDLYAVR